MRILAAMLHPAGDGDHFAIDEFADGAQNQPLLFCSEMWRKTFYDSTLCQIVDLVLRDRRIRVRPREYARRVEARRPQPLLAGEFERQDGERRRRAVPATRSSVRAL